MILSCQKNVLASTNKCSFFLWGGDSKSNHAISWLDSACIQDAKLIMPIQKYLANHITNTMIEFLTREEACTMSYAHARAGLEAISCTDNVLSLGVGS